MQIALPTFALISILMLGYSTSSIASTYWVAPGGQRCQAEPCQCSQSQPCALDQALFNTLKAGDEVKLQSGVYNSVVINAVHGNAERSIYFSGPQQGLPAHIKGNAATHRDAIELRQSSHIVLQHLKVSDAARSGIRLNNSHHISIRHSTLEKNGVWGIFTNHANHFNATGNTIIGPAEQHGIYQSNSGDHVQIIGNYIVNFDGCAVHFNGDLAMGGAPGVQGDGIISNVLIKDNFFAGNGSRGGSAINLDGVDGGRIENNILFDNKATGIAVFKQDGAYGSKHITIERNLIIMAPSSRFAVNFNQSEGSNVLRHNILVAQNQHRGIYDASPVEMTFNRSEPIGKLPFTASNNSYVYQGLFASFNSRRRITLQQWQQQGEDKNSSALKLDHMLLPETKDYQFRVPALLAKQMTQYQIAAEHPYRHLIDFTND